MSIQGEVIHDQLRSFRTKLDAGTPLTAYEHGQLRAIEHQTSTGSHTIPQGDSKALHRVASDLMATQNQVAQTEASKEQDDLEEVLNRGQNL